MARDILVLVDDMFFSAKIGATGQSCGVRVEFVATRDALIAKAQGRPPGLIIIDLNGATTEPVESIRDLKAIPELRTTPVLAFFSHVQTDLRDRAMAAGCDTVMPRSLFSRDLAQILTQHSQ
jgi:CheY-like chemotaxis protein